MKMIHYQKKLLKFENNIKIERGAFLEKQRRPLPNHPPPPVLATSFNSSRPF